MSISLLAALSLFVAACGGDDDAGAGAGDGPTGAQATEEDGGDDRSGPPAGRGSGTLTLGGETIMFDTVGCFLEEQPRAGLGGVFEHSIQARGTNGAGDQVILDITRFRAEDGDRGDRVSIDIGEIPDHESFGASGDVGLVTVEGDSVTATGFTVNGDIPPGAREPETLEASFDLTCGA